jgi:excisionase family DNA binding protein
MYGPCSGFRAANWLSRRTEEVTGSHPVPPTRQTRRGSAAQRSFRGSHCGRHRSGDELDLSSWYGRLSACRFGACVCCVHSHHLCTGSRAPGLVPRRAPAQAVTPAHPQRRPIDLWPDLEHVWLRPAQVASLLDVSRRSVTEKLRRGRLPGVARGARWWVRRDQLELVVNARQASWTRDP